MFDPYRAPDAFVPWLTRWVGLDWLVADDADDGRRRLDAIRADAFPPGLGRLRDVVAAGAALAQWRGTDVGLRLFLTAATGLGGFAVEPSPTDRPFHLVVTAPAEAHRMRRCCGASSSRSSRRPRPRSSRSRSRRPDWR